MFGFICPSDCVGEGCTSADTEQSLFEYYGVKYVRDGLYLSPDYSVISVRRRRREATPTSPAFTFHVRTVAAARLDGEFPCAQGRRHRFCEETTFVETLDSLVAAAAARSRGTEF